MPAFNYTLDVKETGDVVSVHVAANDTLPALAHVAISEVPAIHYGAIVVISENDGFPWR